MIDWCVPPHFSSTAVGMGSEEGDGKGGHISIHLLPSPLLYGEHRGGGRSSAESMRDLKHFCCPYFIYLCVPTEFSLLLRSLLPSL